MKKWEIIYNEHKLNDYCNITNVSKSILPQRTNKSKEIPSANGSYYLGYKYGERIIKVDIYIDSKDKDDYTQKVRDLSYILNVEEPKKMKINDDEGKYVFAVLNGGTDLEKIITTGKTTLEFVCYDPTIYSDKWSCFTPNERGIITLQNDSNYKTYQNIGVAFKNKACFFQATNKRGETVLVGVPKQVGEATNAESDIILDDNCQSKSTFTSISDALFPSKYDINGTYEVGLNGNGIICNNYGSGEDWHGCGFRRNLGTDVDEFEVEIDLVMSSQGENYKIPGQEPLPPEAPPNGSGQCLGTYKVVNCGGLWINREPNTNNPLYAMAPGDLVYPEEIQGIWMKHTFKSKQGQTYTGWSSSKYLQKISDNGRARDGHFEDDFAERQLGNMMIRGYDRSGTVLFENWIYDSSMYFECNEPSIWIGTKKVLFEEATGTRRPDGEASGAIGRFNDFNGKFIIRREKNEAGRYLWSATVNKIEGGKIVASIGTDNVLCDASFPTGQLNYIGVFIGQWKDYTPLSVMALTNIRVKKLNFKTDEEVVGNVTLFNPGDDLQIDFSSGEVTINGINYIERVDIGSNFFETPPGESQIIVRSDDEDMVVSSSIQERYI
ncbi:distal tail protein Dit [Clostridium perfringens]|uniref:distal tail protein Dit n=1 Tax=Clostridium perfringens TaxID=1502 RepID=UPI001E376C08|nr:distal tail protein Dit [Clostridium perfringens]WVL78372.1 distal tail protein Dit [Clostridium perfringens]